MAMANEEFIKRTKVTLEVFRELSIKLAELDQKYNLDSNQYLLIASHLSAKMVKHVTDSCVSNRDVKNIEDQFLKDLKHLFETKDEPILSPEESPIHDPNVN